MEATEGVGKDQGKKKKKKEYYRNSDKAGVWLLAPGISTHTEVTILPPCFSVPYTENHAQGCYHAQDIVNICAANPFKLRKLQLT